VLGCEGDSAADIDVLATGFPSTSTALVLFRLSPSLLASSSSRPCMSATGATQPMAQTRGRTQRPLPVSTSYSTCRPPSLPLFLHATPLPSSRTTPASPPLRLPPFLPPHGTHPGCRAGRHRRSHWSSPWLPPLSTLLSSVCVGGEGERA